MLVRKRAIEETSDNDHSVYQDMVQIFVLVIGCIPPGRSWKTGAK